MSIRGAIFDCDGTLLDSMPMWSKSCIGLLERYGVEDAARVFAEQESLDMDKKCYWYHDHLGIGESGEALYRELWETVVAAYNDEVEAWPGVKAFLQELLDAHIPMVIASSTPPELLKMALAAHGLDTYFSELIFAGDVGRGKEFPDVYLAACKRLGTPREDTWVFEDAPFGVRSATRAGFPVVAITNDHDGRDQDFLSRWAVLVSWGYQNLTRERLESLAPRTLNALVVAGSPEASAPAMVARLAATSDYVIAADRGADALYITSARIDAFCGDEDTASPQARAWARNNATVYQRFSAEKDDTDLGLALRLAYEEADRQGACLRLTLTCASGGRPDHALAVWGVLARNAATAPRVVEDDFECRVLSPEGVPTWDLSGRQGATVSVVPLAPNTVVSEQGLRWELDHKPMELLGDLGVSNKILSTKASVCCHTGVLAVFVR
ncbi:MAG: thiamine diphosphokinase [Coriobacteriales bacterium]|nr:thiamine diphosphokinase [Coriobacteriales bacterium]